MSESAERILVLAKFKDIRRIRDVDIPGVPRALLASLTDHGWLLKLGRGLYTLPDWAASEHESFAEVAARSDGIKWLDSNSVNRHRLIAIITSDLVSRPCRFTRPDRLPFKT
jgi:hypothetical protein